MRRQRPGRWVVARDVFSYMGGWLLIFQQALFVDPSRVNPWFLLLGGSLIGVPGVAEVIAFRGRNASIGTAGASSEPLPEGSSQQ